MFTLFNKKCEPQTKTCNPLMNIAYQIGLRQGLNTNRIEFTSRLKNLFNKVTGVASTQFDSKIKTDDPLLDLKDPLFKVIANTGSYPRLDMESLTKNEVLLFKYMIQRIFGEGLLQSTYIMLEVEKNDYELEKDSKEMSFLRGYGQLLIDYNELVPKEIRDVIIKQYLYLLYKGSSAEEYQHFEPNGKFRQLEDKLSAIFFSDIKSEDRYKEYYNIVDVNEAHNYHLSCMAAEDSLFHLFPSRLEELTSQPTLRK